MEIQYGKNQVNGQSFTPIQTSTQPIVHYHSNPKKLYTLILTDPDAVQGNLIHWLVVNIPGSDIEKGQSILEYYGPHPPKDSGVHTYSFLLLEQTTKIKPIVLDDRYIAVQELLEKLSITSQPMYTEHFTSQFSGGRRKGTMRRKRTMQRKITMQRTRSKKRINRK